MKRASFINRKNTQIREKGRVCQNKQAHSRRRSVYKLGKKRRHLHNKGHAPKTQKAHAYAKKQMRWHNAGNAHKPKSLHAYIKSHMHLHKRVHALGQEVVMLALRNTRARQGNRCSWIWKYMHIRQGAHVLLQDCENGFPRHSMPSASLFRCGMTREQRGRRFLQGRLNVIYFGDYELLRSHPRRNRQREKPMRGCWHARERPRLSLCLRRRP